MIKKVFLLSCFMAVAMAMPLVGWAQTQPTQPTNRYAMKMTQNPDGSYSLQQQKKYERNHIDLSMPDVLVPYTYTRDKLQTKLYKGVESEDIVFKKYKNYELKMTVDKAVGAQAPVPFIIYIHGGGWARGNNSSSKTLSQYLAKQSQITGFRIEYTLAPQSDATVEVSISDVMDALSYIQKHAKELGVDPNRFGFLGTSASAHLAAVGAMKSGAKLFVGYSGIYDLEKATITTCTHDTERKAYFGNLNAGALHDASPINMIRKGHVPVSLLVCGTADVTVECEQSKMMADALKRKGGQVELLVYDHYDHNLSSKTSDKMEEIFFKTVDFVNKYMK